MNDPIILTVRRDFGTTPERVFDAWLDPAKARRFLFATPDGETTRCEIDARVGGRGLIVERRGDSDVCHRLQYKVIERPTRLVFLFNAGPDEEGDWSRVSIAIAPTRTGCTLTLTHEMAPQWAAYEDQTAKGWKAILETLFNTVEE